MDQELKKRLDRIDAKLTALLGAQNKPVWAKVNWVQKITGWTGEELRQAREQGLVEWRENGTGGYLYDINSISERFLIKDISMDKP